MTEKVTDTVLHRYIELDEGYYTLYEAYTPDVQTIEKVHTLLPQAHMVTPVRFSCSDCARNLPKMTRIAEHLPGWTWDIFSDGDEGNMSFYNISKIPTFIVMEPNQRELGRIVENPSSGSLEQDLLAIAQANNT